MNVGGVLLLDEPSAELGCPRVRLRHLLSGDAERFKVWAADAEVQRCYLGAQRASTSPDPKEWVPGAAGIVGETEPMARRPTARCAYLVRVIETVDGETLGWIELRDTNWRRRNGELRICLGDRATWGQGYGSEAIQLFLDLAFGQWHLDSIHLRVATWNTRAVRAYLRCGFRREARLRAGRHAESGMEDLWLMRADRPQDDLLASGAVASPVKQLAASS